MEKTVFITGGAGGIGSALSLEFAKNGYRVALNYNTTDPSAIMEEIKKYSPLSKAYQGDMSDYETAKRVFELAESEAGEINCLINNAGISYVGLFNIMRPEDWKKVFAANVDTVFNCSHLALQSMLRRHEGCIINISSMWGEAGASCEVAYSASKGAVDSFTRALSKEAAPNGVRVNAIACGYIETRMNAHLTEEEKKAFFEEIPLMRAGTPEEAAKAALFLASEDAAYITGEILRVNGGLV
ncbi:MAG: SDR family oxidoreductase [Firmicutes bacterium]|nr:SDR family oxidoreductase [Bacillota bacterium]MBQ9604420.1 SDR family oxidoreductase [Bacillota bacterium]